jgi:hypothetical protein
MNSPLRAGSSVAMSAAVVSITLAVFVPYGQPWTSLAWAVLACAAAVWVRQNSLVPTPRMSEVIRDVEAESRQSPPKTRTVTADRSS